MFRSAIATGLADVNATTREEKREGVASRNIIYSSQTFLKKRYRSSYLVVIPVRSRLVRKHYDSILINVSN